MPAILDSYMRLMTETEPGKIFHIWSFISGCGAIIGRNSYYKLGHNTIFPNMYIMFVGEPGNRKSTAIKLIDKLVQQSGYDTIAADKSSREKFLLDFEEGFTFKNDSFDMVDEEKKLEKLLEGSVIGDSPHEVYIPADEWIAFFGEGNTNFATTLGNLWDYDKPIYRERLKNSKSVSIPYPVVSILGGCTFETFKLAFPQSLLGHGFLSRMLLIYGERSSKRLARPPDISLLPEWQEIVDFLQKLRHSFFGEVVPDKEADDLLATIYETWQDLDDARFKHYGTRRYTQLLKLCVIIAGMGLKHVLEKEDVLLANTILTYTEGFMSKALGEFGAARNSSVTHTILSLIEAADKPVTSKEIWKQVSRDLDKFTDLPQILQSLVQAEKIQFVKDPKGGTASGYLPKKLVRYIPEGLTDYSLIEHLIMD